MTWSLELQNGDLSLDGTGLGTVTSEAKLVQDIRCALLERMGTDNLHPGYGSLIDGGTKPNGTEFAGIIGESDINFVALEIQSEIKRITNEYRNRQLQRAKDDKLVYNKVTLTGGEILLAVGNIDLTQNQDMLNVTIHLQTAGSQNPEIVLSLPTYGLI